MVRGFVVAKLHIIRLDPGLFTRFRDLHRIVVKAVVCICVRHMLLHIIRLGAG